MRKHPALFFFALLTAPFFTALSAWAQDADAPGFPQLNDKTYSSQVFWLTIAFILMYLLMSKIALPKVGAVLDARKAHTGADLDQAQNLQERASKVKTAFEADLAAAQAQAHKTLAETERMIAEKLSAENARFAEHARARVARTEQEIETAKNAALQDISEISSEVAAEMVQKITECPMTKADARKAIASVLQGEA